MTFPEYAALARWADENGADIVESPWVPPGTVYIGAFPTEMLAAAFTVEQVEPPRIDLIAGDRDRVVFRATETLRLHVARPDLLPPYVVKLADE